MLTLLITTTAGLDLMVRLILAGGRYGHDGDLVADQDMIEFYDHGYAGRPGFSEHGQFIARFRTADLGTGSLTLANGTRWRVDHDAMDTVREWCGSQDACTNVVTLRPRNNR